MSSTTTTTSSLGPPSEPPPSYYDTAATDNFGCYGGPLKNIRRTSNPIPVTCANGTIMLSTHEADIDFDGIPPTARTVHLIPNMSSTLISVGKLCDAGCTVHFHQHHCAVRLNNKIIMFGVRRGPNTLWEFRPSRPKPTLVPQANLTHRPSFLPASIKSNDVVAFHHAALGSPTFSTLQKALDNGYLSGFPGLSSQSLRRYPPFSAATIKGHQDLARKNVKSTKPKSESPPKPVDDTLSDFFPSSPSPSQRAHACYIALHEVTGQIYTDQTGRFPIPSSRGNNYLMILYDYDSNAILAEPMTNRTSKEILAAYKRLVKKLADAGHHPKLQRIDNECDSALKDYMRSQGIDFQLVPPDDHRRNAAERAIRTWKNHFIAILCGCDEHFPLHLWCRFLPQAELTLNLLRGSRINPKLSAYAQLFGAYDYNRTPIAPLGTFVQVHEPATKRSSWSPHSSDGWYIGPALDSYRCVRVYMSESQADRIVSTVTWHPTFVRAPVMSPKDEIVSAVQQLADVLRDAKSQTPLAYLRKDERDAIKELSNILANRDKSAKIEPPPVIRNEGPPPDAAKPRVVTPDDASIPRVVADPGTNIDTDIPTYIKLTGYNKVKASRKRRSTRLKKSSASLTTTPNFYACLADDDDNDDTTTEASTSDDDSIDSLPPPVLDSPKFYSSPDDVSTAATEVANNCSRSPSPTPPPAPSADSADADLAVHLEYDVASGACHMCFKAVHPDTGKLAEYRELRHSSEGHLWDRANANEFGRLAQGLPPDQPTGQNTFEFIYKHEVPADKKVTYYRIVANYRPQKADPYRVRGTAGGDRLNYDGPTTTKTSDLTTTKIMANHIVSTKGCRGLCIDLQDFFLCTRLPGPEFMRIPIDVIPASVMKHYDLYDKVVDGFVYVRINGGMYGLKQAGRIANDALCDRLAEDGYHQCKHTPGLFTHSSRPIAFSLVVDDFFVGYVGKEHADHLIHSLKKYYNLSTDWDASIVVGLHMKWDYVNRTVDLSMPGYVEKALKRFAHKVPARRQDAPFPWKRPQYGKKVQLSPAADTSRPLTPPEVKRIQEIVGTFLWYARGVDSTMLTPLSALASSPHQESTLDAVCQFLDYAASHPNATLRFRKSDMQLKVHSDASYLSESKARSRYGGHFYLGTKLKDPTKPPTLADPVEPPQGAILNTSHVIKEVVAAASEAETAGLFYNGKDACPLRVTLNELGWIQDPTPIVTDNSTASGIANDTVKQRRSKAIDMRYYWIRDRAKQGQFLIYWAPGIGNLADYFSKSNHPPSHHRAVRYDYLHPHANLVMRGCVDLSVPSIHDSTGSTPGQSSDAPSLVSMTPGFPHIFGSSFGSSEIVDFPSHS